MTVFLTGSTGFLGRYVLRALLRTGFTVRCLVRQGELPEEFERDDVHIVRGDINAPLEEQMRGCQGVIHLVGIIKEDPRKKVTFERLHTDATRNVVRSARVAGIDCIVHISANGASKTGKTEYYTTKWAAEEAVRGSGLNHWCILRPGLIFGDPGRDREEFCTALARDMIQRLPFIPVFGRGEYEFQPVHVDDVAMAAVQALGLDSVNQQIIVALGKKRLTYIALIDTITRALGLIPKPKVYLPLWFVEWGVRFGGSALPITADQLTMLVEGNSGDASTFFDTFTLQGA